MEEDKALVLPKQEFVGLVYQPGSLPGLAAGVRQGTVVVAKLHVYKRWGMNLCFGKNRHFPLDVVVNSADLRGKGLHGDVVAIELLPVAHWQDEDPGPTRGAGANADDESTADSVEWATPMPGTLPDGRRIVRVLERENGASAAAHLPPCLRLHKEMGGPEGYDWPAGRRPVGRVVAVLQREMGTYHVARLAEGVRRNPNDPIQSGFLYRFRPYNPLLPMLVVAGRNIPVSFHDKLENYLFLLRLAKGADGDVVVARGDMLGATIHCSLGMSDSVQANTAAICAIYDIKLETFPEEAEALVPDSVDIPATAEGVAALGRRDLRQEEFVCTIDPATARDLDDALSIQRTPGGGYHVGVHIADVSFFVEPETALDEEARLRSTSTYFVDHVVPMLPRKLSEIHCSLNPNEDKYAFSSLFEVDKEGHVVSEWFGRSVIRSRCRLAYEEAQQIIDGEEIELNLGPEVESAGESAGAIQQRVYESVKLLHELAAKRRKESLERGRLTIGSTRLGFVFDDMNSQLAPRGFYVKRQIEANWVVEEFMLLANNRAAEKIVQYIPDGAMLRHHLPPDRKKMLALKGGLERCNITLKGSSAKMLQETLDSCKGSKFYDGVCELLKFSQQAAEYFANDVKLTYPRSHFALGLPWYTHFTSPIRRYADIMAHRQLLVALELEQVMVAQGLEMPTRPDLDVVRKPGDEVFDAKTAVNPDDLHYSKYFFPMSEVDAIAADANEAKENARLAGEMSVQLFFCMYLQALFKKATVDPRISPRQFTSVFIIKLTKGSVLLFSPEIASQVEMGMADAKQRFTVVQEAEQDGSDEAEAGKRAHPAGRGRGPAVDGQGREINGKAKAARRRKGGKTDKVDHSQATGDGGGRGGAGGGASASPESITVSWVDPVGGVEPVCEDFCLFTELVVELVLTVKSGRTTLDMIVLPPWEREAYHASGVRIPTSLE